MAQGLRLLAVEVLREALGIDYSASLEAEAASIIVADALLMWRKMHVKK